MIGNGWLSQYISFLHRRDSSHWARSSTPISAFLLYPTRSWVVEYYSFLTWPVCSEHIKKEGLRRTVFGGVFSRFECIFERFYPNWVDPYKEEYDFSLYVNARFSNLRTWWFLMYHHENKVVVVVEYVPVEKKVVVWIQYDTNGPMGLGEEDEEKCFL